MKVLISIVVVIGIILGVWKIWEYWDNVNRQKQLAAEETSKIVDSRSFEGMPQQLDQSYEAAKGRGPEAFGQWLERNRAYIKDPRLAAIELDYVVDITRTSPIEAKRLFNDVKNRIPETSPLYKRIKAMEKTYE